MEAKMMSVGVRLSGGVDAKLFTMKNGEWGAILSVKNLLNSSLMPESKCKEWSRQSGWVDTNSSKEMIELARSTLLVLKGKKNRVDEVKTKLENGKDFVQKYNLKLGYYTPLLRKALLQSIKVKTYPQPDALILDIDIFPMALLEHLGYKFKPERSFVGRRGLRKNFARKVIFGDELHERIMIIMDFIRMCSRCAGEKFTISIHTCVSQDPIRV